MPWLQACASPLLFDVGGHDAVGDGTLTPIWLADNTLEVVLDGWRYVGVWSGTRCNDAFCRGVYSSVPRPYRHDIQRGEAELSAPDGSRLRCTWVSHLPQVDGTCRAQDGREFRLRAPGDAGTPVPTGFPG